MTCWYSLWHRALPRKIAPLVQSKAFDPAVLVLDQQGKYVISLLSGHLGGANAAARRFAAYLGGEAVITTATDVAGVPAFDLFAKQNDLVIENLHELKHISSALVAEEKITLDRSARRTRCLFGEYRAGNPSCTALCRGDFWTSSGTAGQSIQLYLRPKSLVLGVGCKRTLRRSIWNSAFVVSGRASAELAVCGEDCYSCAETKRAGDSGTV
ncbi:MAG: cobalamin biosynthesis central domain-containing protein [Ruminococcus callidus]